MSWLQTWGHVNFPTYMVSGHFVRLRRRRLRASWATSGQAIPRDDAKNPNKVRSGWQTGLADRGQLPGHPAHQCYNKLLLLDNSRAVHTERPDWPRHHLEYYFASTTHR